MLFSYKNLNFNGIPIIAICLKILVSFLNRKIIHYFIYMYIHMRSV